MSVLCYTCSDDLKGLEQGGQLYLARQEEREVYNFWIPVLRREMAEVGHSEISYPRGSRRRGNYRITKKVAGPRHKV